MSNKPATIYDVAQKAGVSPATVSRVLNEPSRVQVERRKKVLAAIEELHFTPKAEAVALARSMYKKIGVIAPFFTEPSFMQRLRGVSKVLSGQHFELVVYAIESSKELDEYIDMLVSSKRVDGLIVLCLNLSDESIAKLARTTMPVCFVESDVPDFDSVVVDNYRGGQLAAEFFYNAGYKTPGFIGEASLRSYAIPATDFRLHGYVDFFSKKDISVAEDHVWLGEFTEEKVDEGVLKLFSGPRVPDCVFTSSDMIALRLMKTVHERAISLPSNFALLGFDDLDIAGFVNLSTVSQSLDESGILAAEMILDRLKNPKREVRKVLVPLKLIERASIETLPGCNSGSNI